MVYAIPSMYHSTCFIIQYFRDLEAQYALVEDQLKDIYDKRESIESEKDYEQLCFKTVLEQKQEEIDTLRCKVTRLNEEKALLEMTRINEEKTVLETTHQSSDLQEEVNTLKEIIERNKNDFGSQIYEKNQQISDLEAKLEKYVSSEEMEHAREEILELKTELEVKQQRINDLENEVQVFQEQINSLKSQVEEKNQCVSDLETTLKGVEKKIVEMETEIEDKEKCIDELKTEQIVQQELISKMDSELGEKKEAISNLEAKMEELQKSDGKATSELTHQCQQLQVSL
jgi:chromosome segregation ATPase